jgi:phenylacetate-CoA ligase
MGIVGRTTDAVKVRGMFVVARQAEATIMSFAPIARFQIVVGRRENRDEVTLKLELREEAVDKAKLADDLSQKFQDTCRVKIDKIEFVTRGTIAENQPRIVDSRKWD